MTHSATRFALAQISDTHVRAAGVPSKIPGDPVDALVAAVERVNRQEPPIDAVIVTGDLVDAGTMEEYYRLREALDRLSVPYFIVPGNHDDRDVLRAAFRDHDYLPVDGPLCYAVEHYPIRLVALDTWVPRRPYGQVGEAQLKWLDETLGEAPDRLTLIFMHHPPVAIGISVMDKLRCRDADALAEIIVRHSQVERIVAGHVHRPVVRRWAGTVVSTSPSPWAQLALTMRRGQQPGYCDEPPAVPLHFWSEKTGLVSHLIPIGKFGFTGL